MEVKFTYTDFPYICRLCLMSTDLRPLSETDVLTVLRSVANIQIEADDNLPQNICEQCVKFLQEISQFSETCRTNEVILKTILEAPTTPEENDANYEDSDENFEEGQYYYEGSCDGVIKSEEDVKGIDPDLAEEETKKKRSRRKKEVKGNSLKAVRRKSSRSKPDITYEDSPIGCSACGTTFTTKVKLSMHYKENASCRPADYKLFKCEVCQKEFSTARRRNEHMNIHTGETPYTCQYCDKTFQLYTAHFKHVYKHRVALGEVELKPGYTEKRVRLNLQCQLCPKVFASRSGFAHHLLVHKGVKVQYKRRVRPANKRNKDVKNFLCNYCAKKFWSKVQLEAHIRGHTGEKPFSCNYCDKLFKTRATLKTHQQKHLGTIPKRFQCEICSKPFALKAHFEVHKRTHTGEKPYACTFCGKSFNYRGTWRIHTRLHTGETPYACPVCGNRYHDKSSLNKHQKKKNHLGKAIVQEKLLL